MSDNNKIKNNFLGMADPEEEKKNSVEIFRDSIVDFLTVTTDLVMEAVDDYNAV